MRRFHRISLPSCMLALMLCTASVRAADHAEAPGAIADPAADLTDIYTWTTPDATKLNMIIGVPAAAFSDAVQYVLHVESSTAYGTPGTTVRVIRSFSAAQAVSCWVGNAIDYVTGDASGPAGIVSATGRTRVFTGRRNDPFFFNLTGFRNTIATVKAAAPSLTFDGAGCPVLDSTTSNALIASLQAGGDSFALGTISAIVLQMDKALIAPGGNIVAVWGGTYRQ